ncbi:MAG TPA: DUF1707 domain-containing protein [Solirubrobacteraceae bacterium]|jgi:hypothetical protein
MSDPDVQRADLRASDEDRERVATALREHAVAGRISTEELEERLQTAYAAQTTAELNAVRRDLPVSPRELAQAHAARRSQLTRRVIQETGGSFALFVGCSAIWLAAGATGQFWPVWILLLFVISLVRNGWALFGPGADLEALEQQLDARRQMRRQKRERRNQRRTGS